MRLLFWKKERKKDRSGLVWLLLLVPVVLVGWVLRERPWRKSYKALRTTHEWQGGEQKQGKTTRQEQRGAAGRNAEKEPQPEQHAHAETRTKYEENRKPSGERAGEKGDELEVVEGIGPKIASILRNAGINTYRDLANASVDRLNKILLDAGVRINPPDTWPEQARLAANGDWEGLDDLKKRLHAGRK